MTTQDHYISPGWNDSLRWGPRDDAKVGITLEPQPQSPVMRCVLRMPLPSVLPTQSSDLYNVTNFIAIVMAGTITTQ